MATGTTLMTAEELWKLPHDHMRHELVKGELITMPPAGFEHGAIESGLVSKLGSFVRANKRGMVVSGDTGFFLEKDPDTVRAADIGFVEQSRIDSIGIPKKFWPGAPDLAVEIISPSDTYYEVDQKVEEWLNAGTALVWVVNPRRKTVTVHTANQNPVVLKANDTLTGDPVLAGFSIIVREIFV